MTATEQISTGLLGRFRVSVFSSSICTGAYVHVRAHVYLTLTFQQAVPLLLPVWMNVSTHLYN